LLSLFHRVTMEQVVPGSVDNAFGDAAQVESLARRLSAEDAQLFYQAALMGRKDLAVTPDARMGFEMTLLRMLAFRPGTDRREPPVVASGRSSSGQESREDPEPGPAASEKITAAVEPEQTPQPEPEQRAEPTPQPEPQPETQEPALESQPAPEEPDAAWLASLDEAAESAAAEAASAEDYGPESVAPESEYAEAPQTEVPRMETAEPAESIEPAEPVEELVDTGEFAWERDFRSLGIVGMPGNLASNAAMTRNGDEIVLTIDEGHARLLNARHEEKILEALRNRFGATITLRVEQGDAGGKTPAAWEERQRQARQKAAEDSIRNDPAVQSIVERFEARVVENSIRPPNQAKSG
ncbi:DNA polymerase III subunit gamma/tau C-terminal domain-containing protein, partial [Marinobacter sp.]